MKLLIDGDVYSWHPGGGISRVFNELIPRFVRRGLDVEVCVRKYVPQGRIGVGVVPYLSVIPQLNHRSRPWKLMYPLAKYLNPWLEKTFWRTRKGDIFLSTYYTTPPVNAPHVCIIHDMIFELFPESFDQETCQTTIFLKQKAVALADSVACVSDNTRRDLIRLLHVPETKCLTIYNGGPPACLNTAPLNMEFLSKPYLLYVGDYKLRYKNFNFMLECIGKTQNSEIASLHLVVAARAQPSKADLLRYQQWVPPDRLHFIVSPSDQLVGSLYRQCVAFIYPSLYEGFGLPVLEALSEGAPVVCSNASSLPEVGGSSVQYFDPMSSVQFEVALIAAISEGRNDVVVAKRKKQAALFSWENAARAYIEVFCSISKKLNR